MLGIVEEGRREGQHGHEVRNEKSGIQWNLSNPDTLGAEESVLIGVISGVELYTDLAFGIAKCPVYQGVLIRGVPLYTQ